MSKPEKPQFDEAKFSEAIEKLFDAMAYDYRAWKEAANSESFSLTPAQVSQATEEYRDSLTYTVGQKYIKLIKTAKSGGRGVVGFIQIADDKKFQAGDLLKAQNLDGPTRNFARGNIFSGYAVRWTGL